MNRHLVAVKVSVERRTDQRVQLNGLAFDQNRLKSLDAQAVQSWRTVEHDGMFTDHLIEDIPNFRPLLFNQFLSLFYSRGQAFSLQAAVNEGFKELQRHFLWQAALVQLELRTGHNHRTTREVDAFAQEVLTETTLLAFEHVRQGFQRAFVLPGDHPAPTAIVEQGINRFLQHALFVAHNDVGRAQFNEALQTVVAVDHTTIKIVQIRSRKTAAIQRHQGAQLRWDHWDHSQDHPLWTVARFNEALNDFQALDDLLWLQFTGGF